MSSVTIDHEGCRTYRAEVSFWQLGAAVHLQGEIVELRLGSTETAKKAVGILRQAADRLEHLMQDAPQPGPKTEDKVAPRPELVPETKLATPDQVIQMFAIEAEKRCKAHGREWEHLGRSPTAAEIETEIKGMITRCARNYWWGWPGERTGLRFTVLPLTGFELDLRGTDLKRICSIDYPGMVR